MSNITIIYFRYLYKVFHTIQIKTNVGMKKRIYEFTTLCKCEVVQVIAKCENPIHHFLEIQPYLFS